MEQFNVYFQVGLAHITDIRGYDHILFIIALCAVYFPRNARPLLLLITAFTLGHSITLALATFDIVQIDSQLIEMLIPVTIIITALFNFQRPRRGLQKVKQKHYLRYLLAAFFGLIHGLGFSNYLKTLLLQSQSITIPLLAFNVGLEVGQILVVLVLLILCFIFVYIFKLKERDWTIFLSGISFGVALSILIEKLLN